jgi:tyrosine-protein kinase Etk/Wzc
MDNPVKKSTDNEKEVFLLDYLIVLAKHSRMIIYSSLAVSALALLILLLIPNQYTATARLMPPQQNMTLSGQLLDQLGGTTALPSNMAANMAGGLAAGLLGLRSPGDLYVGMLAGDTIADRIIERFKLKEYYKSWLSFTPPYIEDLRIQLSKRVVISVGKEDGLVTIEATDEDPQRAADMANAYVEELDKLLGYMAHNEAQARMVFLEKERSKAIQNLAKAEADLRAFSEQTNVLQIDAQTKGILEYTASLRAQIDAKEIELQVLRQTAAPSNFDVIRIDTEIQGLKQKLQTAETQGSQNPRLGDVMLSASKVPALGLDYIRLYREAKYQENLYQLFCKLVEIANLDILREAVIVQVVDQGKLPEKKSKPKRLLISILIGFVAMVSLIFYSFFLEYWENLNKIEGNEAVAQLRFYKDRWLQEPKYLLSLLKRQKPKI